VNTLLAEGRLSVSNLSKECRNNAPVMIGVVDSNKVAGPFRRWPRTVGFASVQRTDKCL
jgi:hypothetical protein